MSTQTVYFNNPADIVNLQTTTATQTTQIASLQQQSNGFPFEPVPCAADTDYVAVPSNYKIQVVMSEGDPMLSSVPAYSNQGTDNYTTFDKRVGQRQDGMMYMGLTVNAQGTGSYSSTSSTRGLLVCGFENNDSTFLHTGGFKIDGLDGSTGCMWTATRPFQDVLKEIYALGIGVFEVSLTGGNWIIVKDSPFNRRVHGLSTINIEGPLKGHSLVQTKFDPTGQTTRGTANDCGGSVTPWHTYMVGEENERFHFSTPAPELNRTTSELNNLKRNGAAQGSTRNWYYFRYGRAIVGQVSIPDPNFTGPASTSSANASQELWYLATGYVEGVDVATGAFKQWDITANGSSATDDYRNMYNCFGYMVEVDPFDPNSPACKRTALGKMCHENGSFAPAVSGQPIVCYLNDDTRSEYVYKYVSQALWDPADEFKGIQAGHKYLNTGTLYVAKFNTGTSGSTYGLGTWLPLTTANVSSPGAYSTLFPDLATICAYTRLAADTVGATRTDRPEWAAVDPATNIVYQSMTNNREVKLTNTAASVTAQGNPPISAWSPRYYNDVQDKEGILTDYQGNINGGIMRYQCYSGSTANIAGTTFRWDHFLFGCAPYQQDFDNVNISRLDESNCFSMPDTVIFGQYSASKGYMWFCTDDEYMAETTIDGVYCVKMPTNPQIGDGKSMIINSTSYNLTGGYNNGSGSTITYVGNQPQVARFLRGIPGCELSAWAETPDGKYAFTIIQHPGEMYAQTNQLEQLPQGFNPAIAKAPGYRAVDSHFPLSRYTRPKTTCLAISRKDGNPIV